jgi:hypothetical protein
MYYVGLDIHQRSTSVEILDCNGKLVKRAEWKLPWPQLADQLKKEAPAPFAVCFEASCGYGYLFEEFSKVAQMVKAAHPGSLHLIYKSQRLDGSFETPRAMFHEGCGHGRFAAVNSDRKQPAGWKMRAERIMLNESC